MVSWNLLTQGLTMLFVICLCTGDKYEDYQLLKKQGNQFRLKQEGYHGKLGKDYISPKLRSYFKASGDYNRKDTHDFTKGKESHKRAEFKTTPVLEEEENSIFLKGLNGFRHMYNECNKKISIKIRKKLEIDKDSSLIKRKLISLYNCIKVLGISQLDEYLSDDIPVSEYFEFVKDIRNKTANFTEEPNSNSLLYSMDIINKSWTDLVFDRIDKFLLGHSLKFRLNDNTMEGRGRRRDHRMFAMMMMGFIIMSSILVPMGFQFLTVLGGKSLLMAKMALIMSAINGLKKIATSNVGYGLYHAGPEPFHHDPHHHGFHEKIFHVKAEENPNLPFNVVI